MSGVSDKFAKMPHPRTIDMRAAAARATIAVPYRVRPFAIDAALTLLVGRGGESKTWLGLVACAGVHGGQQNGFADPLGYTSGKAIYLDAENGEREMVRRFTALALDLDDGLIVANGSGLQLPRDVAEVEDIVRHYGANLLVIDSLRRLTAGLRENDSDDMAPVMAALSDLARGTGCAVVVIHHRAKSMHAADVRGSSALADQADAVFVLEKVEGDPERRTRRRLRCAKMRSDREPSSIWLDFKSKAGFMTMVEAEPYDGDGEDQIPAHEVVADEIRAVGPEVLAAGGWSPRELAEAVNRSRQDRTFKAALSSLLESGEWAASGSTRDRKVGPAFLGNSVTPLGTAPSTQKETRKPEGAESPINTGVSGSDRGPQLWSALEDDYPKSNGSFGEVR